MQYSLLFFRYFLDVKYKNSIEVIEVASNFSAAAKRRCHWLTTKLIELVSSNCCILFERICMKFRTTVSCCIFL